MASKQESKDGLRDILEKLETPQVRWALVFLGVIILVRLRLILFAAALPVMAYWHYSNQPEEGQEQQQDGDFNGATLPGKDDMDEDESFGDDSLRPPPHRGQARRDDDDADEGKDPYGESFWSGNAPAARSPPDNAMRFGDDDDAPAPARSSSDKERTPWDDDPSGGRVDEILPDSMGLNNFDLPPLGADDDFGLGKDSLSFSFLGDLGGGDDMDFLSSSMGSGFGRGGGKGKGKGKKGDREKGEGKGDKGPREANPKQVFVAGVGDLPEDEIRMFFEEVGEVDRLKILTTPEGESKGVCFVTFSTEEQAQKALGLHGSDCSGRTLTVRLAHGGNKGEKGDKGDKGKGKGDRGGGFAFNERFGGLGDDDRGDRGDRPPKGKGKGGRGRNERSELDELLEEALADGDGPAKASDFDFAARRFLSELRSRDRSDNTERFNEALDMVLKYTASKDRSSVRKWPAYIFTLLQKFDPRLWDELRERDAERRTAKGKGGFDRPPREDRDDD